CTDAAESLPPAAPGEYRNGYVAPAEADTAAALRGARLGVAEASWAGDLIGTSIELLVEEVQGARDAVRAADRLHASGAVAVIGGGDDVICSALSEWADRTEAIFLNVGCRDDTLRD